MKQSFRKSKLTTFVITALLSGMYAQSSFSSQSTVMVGMDNMLTIPETKESINKKVETLSNDSSVKKYTPPKDENNVNQEKETVLIGDELYGPSTGEEDQQKRNLINKNTLVNINKEFNDNTKIIVGGGSILNDEDVKLDNLNVLINNDIASKGIFGAYNKNYDSSVGNVYIVSDDLKIKIQPINEDDRKTGIVGVYSESNYSSDGNVYIASNNANIMIKGQRGIYGSMSNFGNSSNGSVYITSGNTTTITIENSGIFGSYSSGENEDEANYGDSKNGNVYITGGILKNSDSNYLLISGSIANFGNASNGNVYITGGSINNFNISGSVSGYDNALNGKVYIAGGTIANESSFNISGANSYGKNAQGDLFISGGHITTDNIYGAFLGGNAEKAEGNVSLFGNVDIKNNEGKGSNIYGGYYSGEGNANFNIFNDNLFSIASNPITVSTVGNFAKYDFYLNQYNKDAINDSSKALLTVTDTIKNNDTFVDGVSTQNKSTVKLAGVSKDVALKKDDTVILIDASAVKNFERSSDEEKTENISDLFATIDGEEDEIDAGLIGKVDVVYGVDDANKQITATIKGYHVDKNRANETLKPLAEGRLTTLENAVRSAEALQDVMGEHKPIGTFTPIAEISGGINKYDGNTAIESRDYRLIVGSRYQILDNLYAGIALDYGRSNYNSDNGNKRGEGNTYNYGASLFSKYTDSFALGDVYFDGALRLGRTSTDMKSNDIITSNNEFAGYKSRVNYVGANTGLGFIYKLNEKSSFDTSTHYYWTRLGSDNISIDGDDIHFSSTNSSKVQFKEQYNYKTTDNLTFTLAGVYEYEFDSKAGASSSGVSIDAPSMQGSTKIVELGIKGTPIAESKDFNFNLKFRGYAGKRNGASASAFFEYDF